MSKMIDMAGRVCGRLTVLERASNRDDTKAYWKCRCACGKETVVSGDKLRRGRQSCGCIIHVHDMHRTPEYKAWRGAIGRCIHKSHPSWRWYGARGIKVCAAWRLDFLAFFREIGPRPSSKHSLDRIDNNRDYEPGNVRWATAAEQLKNRRTTRWLTFQGRTQTVGEWARELKINYCTLIQRITMRGWSVESAITTPSEIKYRGKSLCRNPQNTAAKS